MSPVPAQPKIYHITHVDNLPAIVRDRVLVSDATMLARGGPSVTIGMSEIKRRRIEEIMVTSHPDTKVGDYVPFYFCPRSVMLYLIYRANHQDLSYRGGQDPIVHLEADLTHGNSSVESECAPRISKLGRRQHWKVRLTGLLLKFFAIGIIEEELSHD